jgi:hypothetical protein
VLYLLSRYFALAVHMQVLFGWRVILCDDELKKHKLYPGLPCSQTRDYSDPSLSICGALSRRDPFFDVRNSRRDLDVKRCVRYILAGGHVGPSGP